MERAEQIAQTKQMLAHLANGTTDMAPDLYRNPVRDYTDPAQWEAERRHLFGDYPLCLGLSGLLPEPGDWRCVDEFGVPILLVRDREGHLQAFLNVCRHRGARVAEGSGGGARRFSCPYHGWSYGLDGRLRGRPQDPCFLGADKASHGLTPLPVAEHQGLIWVHPQPDRPLDLPAALGGLESEFAAYGLDGFHHYETRRKTVRMNWKLVVDTFLESYHLCVLHVNTIDPILHSNVATFRGFGRNQRMAIPRRTFEAMRTQPEADWDFIRETAIVYILFPNTVFIVQGDHLELWHVYPSADRPDEASMRIDLYTPEPATTPSAKRHWDRNFDLLMATVEDEDFPVGEGAQRGFLSPAQSHITFGRNEPALHYYHGQISAALNAGADNSTSGQVAAE